MQGTETRTYQLVWSTDDNIHFIPLGYRRIDVPNTVSREIMAEICNTDIDILVKKNATYQDSWKKRGGIDTFYMLARKWDRIEAMVSSPPTTLRGVAGGGIGHHEQVCDKYNILEYIEHQSIDTEGKVSNDDNHLLAQVQDLRRYLLLVEQEILQRAYTIEDESLIVNDEETKKEKWVDPVDRCVFCGMPREEGHLPYCPHLNPPETAVPLTPQEEANEGIVEDGRPDCDCGVQSGELHKPKCSQYLYDLRKLQEREEQH